MKYILFCGNYRVFDGMLSTMLSIFKRSVSKAFFFVEITGFLTECFLQCFRFLKEAFLKNL